MIPEEISSSDGGTLPPEAPTPAAPERLHINVMAARGEIKKLMEQLPRTGEQLRRSDQVLQRARFGKHPVDLAAFVVDNQLLMLKNQVVMMRSLMFILDEVLALEGVARFIAFQEMPAPANGNGKGEIVG